MKQEQADRLKAPFPAEDVQWRAGATNREGAKALAMAYIDARAVMDRLDEVVGPMNWADTYNEWKGNAVKAGIGIRNEEGWVWKFDGADDTNFEATKGGFSDAFKRAAVKWGIGRYLYQLPTVWVACQKSGNTVRLSTTPKLPQWALPAGTTQRTPTPQAQEPTIPQSTPSNGDGSQALQWDSYWDKYQRAQGMVVPFPKHKELTLAQIDLKDRGYIVWLTSDAFDPKGRPEHIGLKNASIYFRACRKFREARAEKATEAVAEHVREQGPLPL